MVTAELATALPALAVVVIACVWAVSIALAQLQVADAAREAARAAARGDAASVVTAVAEQTAPDGAVVEVHRSDGVVTVQVAVRIAPPLPLGGHLPSLVVSGDAVAHEEAP